MSPCFEDDTMMNAARFGWFHPAWADEGGSGAYEPWHWEFAS